MKRILTALWLGLAFATPAAAQSEAIEDVIAGQFGEFREDDFVAAFDYASPMIQGIFRTPENFGMMVRQGYPMVWRPAEWTFLDLREAGGRLFQRVEVTDAQGATHLLEYRMVETETGWKIDGVMLIKAPGVAA